MNQYPFLKEIAAKLPSLMSALQPTMTISEAILTANVDGDLQRAVQAQVAVAMEHYGGVLACSVNDFGLASEAASRNLYDVVVGTMYLIRHPELVAYFLEFGRLTVYRLMRNVEPEDPTYQAEKLREVAASDAEYQALELKFRGKNFWHSKRIAEISDELQFGHLYRMFYKTTSGIIHGSSYPILGRNQHGDWYISHDRARWSRYVKESAEFGFLILLPFFDAATACLGIRCAADFDAMKEAADRIMHSTEYL